MIKKNGTIVLWVLILTVAVTGLAVAETETETVEWTEMPYGAWMAGTWTGVEFNDTTGKYEGIGPGMGYIWVFRFDDTFAALSMFFENLYVTGKYEVQGEQIKLTERAVQETKDGGVTWSEPEAIPDESIRWVLGNDDHGAYILMVEMDAEPPFEHGVNAFRYDMVQGVPIF